MYYIIYKTINLINLKFYIGMHRTENLDDKYLGSGEAICNAIKKYGKENFKREILYFYETEEEMINKEKEILSLKFIKENKKLCYNIATGGFGGDSITNHPNRKEIIKKISESHKGHVVSEETKEKMSKSSKGKQSWIKGKTHSEETRKKLSENNWNKKHSGKDSPSFEKKAPEETKNKLKLHMIGNKFAVGNKMSDVHKNKLRQIHKGKIVSEETKRKIRETKIGPKNPMYGKLLSEETKEKISRSTSGNENHFYGKTHSEETIKIIREKNIGRKHTEETKRKMSESRKLYHCERKKSENESLSSAPTTCK